jgi:hypothetical protein
MWPGFGVKGRQTGYTEIARRPKGKIFANQDTLASSALAGCNRHFDEHHRGRATARIEATN